MEQDEGSGGGELRLVVEDLERGRDADDAGRTEDLEEKRATTGGVLEAIRNIISGAVPSFEMEYDARTGASAELEEPTRDSAEVFFEEPRIYSSRFSIVFDGTAKELGERPSKVVSPEEMKRILVPTSPDKTSLRSYWRDVEDGTSDGESSKEIMFVSFEVSSVSSGLPVSSILSCPEFPELNVVSFSNGERGMLRLPPCHSSSEPATILDRSAVVRNWEWKRLIDGFVARAKFKEEIRETPEGDAWIVSRSSKLAAEAPKTVEISLGPDEEESESFLVDKKTLGRMIQKTVKNAMGIGILKEASEKGMSFSVRPVDPGWVESKAESATTFEIGVDFVVSFSFA